MLVNVSKESCLAVRLMLLLLWFDIYRRLEILLGWFPLFWINIGLKIQGTVQNPSNQRGPQRPPPSYLVELIAHPNRPLLSNCGFTCGSFASLLPSCPPLLLYLAGHPPDTPPPQYEPGLAQTFVLSKGSFFFIIAFSHHFLLLLSPPPHL